VKNKHWWAVGALVVGYIAGKAGFGRGLPIVRSL
jgi:hypothetical protein